MDAIFSIPPFLIPGVWNICQDDWTSIERYSRERKWRGKEEGMQILSAVMAGRQSGSHQDVMSITHQPACVCEKDVGHTETSYNT